MECEEIHWSAMWDVKSHIVGKQVAEICQCGLISRCAATVTTYFALFLHCAHYIFLQQYMEYKEQD